MTLCEFFEVIEGFNQHEEDEWRRVYVLRLPTLKEGVTFDEFMGRKEPDPEDKFEAFWEMVKRDRAKGKDARCTAS